MDLPSYYLRNGNLLGKFGYILPVITCYQS